MGQIWLTSDTHFGHAKVAALRGFDSVAEHDRAVLGNLRRVLRDGDELWHLGDVTLGPNREHALAQIAELPGSHHLVLGNHDACVDRDSRAVTKRGFLRVDQLTDDDEVLSVADDLTACWVQPTRIVRKHVSEPLIRISGPRVDALVTADHRVIYQSFDKIYVPKWRECVASEFRPNSKTGFVTSGRGLRVDSPILDEAIRLAAWLHTDSHFNGRTWNFYQRESKAEVIRRLLPSGQFTERSRTRDILAIDGTALARASETQIEFYVRTGEFNQSLTDLVPDRNHLAPWVWQLSERQVDLLVFEWEYTDGTVPTSQKLQTRGRTGARARTTTVLYCSRSDLRRELMALMTANGWRTSETEYRPGHWRINATKRLVTSQPRLEVEEQDYQGEVWCLTVPTGRFFIERNGLLHLTGNCHPLNSNGHRRQAMYRRAFHTVQTTARINYQGLRLMLSHFPYEGDTDGRGVDRYVSWRLRDESAPLLCGHTHSAQRVTRTSKGTVQIQVGLDAWGLRPVTIHDAVREAGLL